MFFEHSSWSLETKKVCGWYDFKSKIVGNPKYDNIDSKYSNNQFYIDVQ